MPSRTPVLILIQGDQPGARWRLQETRVTTVGRSSRSQVSLASPAVSQQHCEISFVDGFWQVADLNSEGGTYVNGRKIAPREALNPGDIIKMGTNALRFDLVHETAKEDEALTAIRDASLNVGAASEGETAEGLDEMRLRSQLSAAEEDEKRSARKKVLQNAVFVSAVALIVALTVGAGLAIAHSSARRARQETEQWTRDAHQAYVDAQKSANGEPEQRLSALSALRQVTKEYAGTEAATDAAVLCQRLEGAILQSELERVGSAEGAGDYKDALDRTSRLVSLLSDPVVNDLLETRQCYTEQLARVAFRTVQAAAARFEEHENDPEAAIALYRQAIARIGLAEVAEAANARIREIEQRHSTPPETAPKPEPARDEPENLGPTPADEP